jgi:HEAT repeat protein
LSSPHIIVRRRAVVVLGRRRLGPDIGRRVLPLLCPTIRQDSNAEVRRQAVLSLLWWRSDSRHLAEVVREALTDSAAEVRETAASWLREQLAGEPSWALACVLSCPVL